MNKKILLLIGLVAYLPCSAFGAPVYKVTEKDGSITYTSKAPSKDAKPAKLPEIMRGEVKLVEQKLLTCDKHGGVNCQAGPDSDGSVICLDGFKNAAARFRFTCNSPKLEITDISETSPQGGFTVFVRNSKSVAAQKPILLYTTRDGKEVKIAGPETIDPFGVAEFQFAPVEGTAAAERPTIADLNLTCANCP